MRHRAARHPLQHQVKLCLPGEHLLKTISCSNLRSKPNDIRELDANFRKSIEEAENCMKKLHNRVVEISEDDHSKEKLGTPTYNRILKVCNGLVSVYFGQVLHRTINHIIQTTAHEDTVPYLKLSINYKDSLVLQPTAHDLIIIYSLFIGKLVEGANNFLVLEYYRKKNFPSQFLYIGITDEFVSQATAQVAENICRHYVPIGVYVKKLDEDFAEIYTDLSVMGSLSGSSSGADAAARFDFGCEQITHYRDYMKKASSMLSSEYFGIGQLILSEYVTTMKESLAMVIENIFNEMCGLHVWEDEQICQAFEGLKAYALTKPSTTEDLIAQGNNQNLTMEPPVSTWVLGKYMIWAKTVLLNELKDRIQQMLCNLTKLVDFGTLSPEHVQLNAATVQWLTDIEQVLEINSSMYEQIKFEYEERLQATIKYVNGTIEKLLPMLGEERNVGPVKWG